MLQGEDLGPVARIEAGPGNSERYVQERHAAEKLYVREHHAGEVTCVHIHNVFLSVLPELQLCAAQCTSSCYGPKFG